MVFDKYMHVEWIFSECSVKSWQTKPLKFEVCLKQGVKLV